MNIPMKIQKNRVWSMERQVRLAAGGLVMAGLALGRVHSSLKLISWFVGGGLAVSAFTRKCGLANALGRLPFNDFQRTPGGRLK